MSERGWNQNFWVKLKFDSVREIGFSFVRTYVDIVRDICYVNWLIL